MKYRIEACEFGLIRVAGVEYTSDIVLLPDRILDRWRRVTGHSLCMDDLRAVMGSGVTTLVIGTGMSARMEVPETVVSRLQAEGITAVVLPTPAACDEYNRLLGTAADSLSAAALHLTC